MDCHKIAKSNPQAPPAHPAEPQYPFQLLAADYFHHGGKCYLVIVDRYSHWPLAYQADNGASGLVKILRGVFSTYGVAEEVASDGGKEFTAEETQQFLKNWSVHHRLSSVAFPHSNCRAELAVKQVKRIIMSNISPSGSLDVDSFHRGILSYRNTIDPVTKFSPALAVFGRQVRDGLPVLPGKYNPHNTWKELLEHREKAMAQRQVVQHEAWSEHTKTLPPLPVGAKVFIQNQVGNHPRRWERTGKVVEAKDHDQYIVRVDGTGRVTLRNRKFLRSFTPITRIPPTQTSQPITPSPPVDSATPTKEIMRSQSLTRTPFPDQPVPVLHAPSEQQYEEPVTRTPLPNQPIPVQHAPSVQQYEDVVANNYETAAMQAASRKPIVTCHGSGLQSECQLVQPTSSSSPSTETMRSKTLTRTPFPDQPIPVQHVPTVQRYEEPVNVQGAYPPSSPPAPAASSPEPHCTPALVPLSPHGDLRGSGNQTLCLAVISGT